MTTNGALQGTHNPLTDLYDPLEVMQEHSCLHVGRGPVPKGNRPTLRPNLLSNLIQLPRDLLHLAADLAHL